MVSRARSYLWSKFQRSDDGLEYVRERRGGSLPIKQVVRQDSIDSFKGAMISHRDYDRELYYPKKVVAFDDGRHRSRSRSSRNPRRRHHSKYSDNSESEFNSDRSSEDEKETLNARKKTLLYTGLATVTTIAAGNNLYQSTKAHQARKKQIREGKLSEYEAQELKREHRKRNLISLGLAAAAFYNTRNGWKRMKIQQEEEQKIREEREGKLLV
ncbi:MAG: hypothetical protein Q9166_002176 [cf. Caloplaca sp. 2 TL-2023]